MHNGVHTTTAHTHTHTRTHARTHTHMQTHTHTHTFKLCHSHTIYTDQYLHYSGSIGLAEEVLFQIFLN